MRGKNGDHFTPLANRVFALRQTSRANRHSDEANNIKQETSIFAKRAMQLQEDEGKLQLAVKPQMLFVMGDGKNQRARPVVTAINFSAFPLTIEKIRWKTSDSGGKGVFWINQPSPIFSDVSLRGLNHAKP